MTESKINVLVACEESQAVCKELRKMGINAFSCDILECSGGCSEWHIKDDLFNIAIDNSQFYTQDGMYHRIAKWHAVIAFPPCTHLAVSGARHFEIKRTDGRQKSAIKFFMDLYNLPYKYMAVENPVNIISGDYVKKYFPELCEKYNLPIKPTQHIEPWNFGDNTTKNTCLWLRGFKPLIKEITEKPDIKYKEWVTKDGIKKRCPLWHFNTIGSKNRSTLRSKTFPGIAHAMATQWGKQLINEIKEN